MENPYISFVAVARNDNYGGNFLHRLQVFINSIINSSEKYKLSSELIIVEWNPPQDRPFLKDKMKWPQNTKYCRIRIIQVPNEVHNRFPKFDRIGLFEYLGKNVGARRARGEYILTTNSDLIYPEELIEFFANKKLKPSSFYRLDRYDFDYGIEVPIDLGTKEQINFLMPHFLLINNRYGSAFLRNEKLFSLRKFIRFFTYLKNVIIYFPYPPPYNNADGDFFLMHRNNWFYLKGYPELGDYNFPNALCFMALALGLKQIILKYPLVVYHQQHQRVGEDRPGADLITRKKQYRKMLKDKKPWIPNQEDWGLALDNLPETQVL